MSKRLRIILGVIIVALTIAAFAYYLSHHTYLLHQLAQTPPIIIVFLVLLYGLWFGTLAIILLATLKICRKTIGTKENLLLNAYSSLANFFVPGQSGPVIRGAYLKKRHGLRVRDYVFVTLLYYTCYALVSAFMLLASSRPWWQTALALVLVGSISYLVVHLYGRQTKAGEDSFNLTASTILNLLLATLLQAIIQVAIYAVELHSVNPHITIWQAITYTGAANFALFVALTPGAIGIRESFLLFSQHLHHISSANIVAASIIDRSVFILFLAILFLITIAFHAKDKLHIKPAYEKTEN